MSRLRYLWEQPGPQGYGPSITGFGGVAAPLLAGFALAAIVTLLNESAKTVPHEEFAVTSFSLATVCLLLCIQYTYLAAAYWISPEDGLEWVPEARRDYRMFQLAVQRQQSGMKQFKRYARRADLLFHLGVIAMFLGVAGVLLPRDWNPPRVVALTFVTLGAAVQLLWMGGLAPGKHGRALRELSRWVTLQRTPTVFPPRLEREQIALVAEDNAALRSMIRGARHARYCATAPLSEVTFDHGLPAEFREKPLSKPVITVGRWGQDAAMFSSGDRLLVVLSDRVVFGCEEHVVDRLRRMTEHVEPTSDDRRRPSKRTRRPRPPDSVVVQEILDRIRSTA